VHLILVPSNADGLCRALARAHRTYAGIVQARRRQADVAGRQVRAIAMDEERLAAALRHVSRGEKRQSRVLL